MMVKGNWKDKTGHYAEAIGLDFFFACRIVAPALARKRRAGQPDLEGEARFKQWVLLVFSNDEVVEMLRKDESPDVRELLPKLERLYHGLNREEERQAIATTGGKPAGRPRGVRRGRAAQPLITEAARLLRKGVSPQVVASSLMAGRGAAAQRRFVESAQRRNRRIAGIRSRAKKEHSLK